MIETKGVKLRFSHKSFGMQYTPYDD